MAKLKSAWTVHLASVRNRFFDHIDAAAITQVADAPLIMTWCPDKDAVNTRPYSFGRRQDVIGWASHADRGLDGTSEPEHHLGVGPVT